MEKLKVGIKSIIEEIDKTVVLLEQCKDKEAYTSMAQIIHLLNLILPNIIQNENNEIYINQNKFIKILTKTLEAMEHKDNLFLADMLQYELKEMLNKSIIS